MFKAFAIVMGVFIGLSSLGYVLGWFGEAAAVAQDEFGPREALRKYEWFKDTSAALDKKQADIAVFKKRAERADERCAKTASRHDCDTMSQAETELTGVVSSYNDLAGRYNAAMAKFNWEFANAGTLPAGADRPLPREYKPYVTE